MRPRDADLSGLWEGVKYRYELLDRPVPRVKWLVYAAVHWLFRRWQW